MPLAAIAGSKREQIYKELLPQYHEFAFCAAQSARKYSVPEIYLLAILKEESGRIGIAYLNNNGTADYGITGINTVRKNEIEKIGYSLDDVARSGCKALDATAYLLAEEIRIAQNSIIGLGNYHYDITGKYPENHFRYRTRLLGHMKKINKIIQN